MKYVFGSEIGITEYEGRFSHNLGGIAEYKLNESWTVYSGVQFAQKSHSFVVDFSKNMCTNPNNPTCTLDDILHIRNNSHFIELPIGVNFDLLQKSDLLFTNLGTTNSFRLTNKNEGDPILIDIEGYRKFLSSATIGIGIRLPISENFSISLESDCQFYFYNIHSKSSSVKNPILPVVSIKFFRT